MNKIIPSMIKDSGEYYIHMEEYKKVKELGEHYKHLYSEVKKQKDDVVEYVNSEKFGENFPYIANECQVKSAILRMLGEIDDK